MLFYLERARSKHTPLRNTFGAGPLKNKNQSDYILVEPVPKYISEMIENVKIVIIIVVTDNIYEALLLVLNQVL